MAVRLAPDNVLYSNETKWQHLLNDKSPSRHSNCKCKEVIERKKKNDCESCIIKGEIKIRKDAQTSPGKLEESPKNSKRDLSPKERPSSGKFQRKQLLSPSKQEISPPSTRGTLEKSNSLNETKPPKQLRTTKSLSPRPPIKHQHAITVSDEHNVVSLKVSPGVDDYDDVLIKGSFISDSSPEGAGSLQLDDRHKNHRSTSCLVYVPTDPWTKMEPSKGKKKGGNRMKKLMDVKSLSRPDGLVDDDPWVFDESRTMKDKKSATFRGTHSKSLHVESKSGTARPRLQRSKSPVFDEHLRNPPSSPNNLSFKDPLSSLSPKLGYHSVPDENSNKAKKKNQFLNVSNPNLLQPRHSFSTSTSKKDDELTLNIRRLSEQIKYSSNYASYGNFSSASTTANTSPKPGEMDKKSSSLLSDSLLETTC